MANGSEVGQGHVSIFPVMTGFRSTVLKEIQGSGDAGSSLFSRIFKGVGSKTGTSLGRDLKSSFDGSTGDLGAQSLRKLQSNVSSATRAMSTALLKQQDATGGVRVAQAKLTEAVAKYGEGSSQAIAASERLASAQRREQAASQTLTTATERLKAAKQAIANVPAETVKAPNTSLFTAAIDRIKNSVRSLDGEKIDTVSANMDRFSLKWGVIAGVAQAGAQKVMGLFSGMGQAAMDASDSTDKFKSTLTFAGLDTGTIDRLTKSTQAYADETVYDLSDIRNVTSQLAANGVKDYDRLAEASGNLNAVAGGNAETFKSVGMVLTQTAGAGKLTTENWNQLADAIPGASGKLQEAMRKNGAYTGNFRDAMEKGQITADEFNKAIMDLGMTDAAEKAARSTSTFEGAIGNWQAAVTGFGQSVLTALKPQLTGAINWATGKLSNFTNWFTSTWDLVSGLVSKGDFAGAFKKAFHIDDGTMSGLLDSLDGIKTGFKQIVDAVAPVKASFSGVNDGFTLANRGVGGLTSALQLVQPVLPIIANLIKLFEGLPQPVQTGIAATVLFGGQMKSVIGPVSGAINILKSLTGIVGGVGGAIGDLVSNKLGRTQALTGLSDTLSATASSAEDATGGLGHAASSAEKVGSKASGASGKASGLLSMLGGFTPAGVAFGAAATGVTLAMAGVADDAEKTKNTVNDFKTALQQGGNATDQFFNKLKTGGEGSLGFFDKLNSGQNPFTDGKLTGAMKTAGISFDTVKQAVIGSGDAMQEINDKSGSWWNQISTVSGSAAKVVQGQVNKMRDAYKDTITQMIEYSKTQDSITAGFGSASSKFNELSVTLKANGDNLKDNGKLSQESSQYLQSAAGSALEAAKAQVAYGKANGDTAGSVQEAKNQIQQMRDQLVSTLTQYGMSEDAANKYADALGLIPGDINSGVFLDTTAANSDLTAFLDRMGATPEQKTTVMNALTDQADGNVDNLHLKIKDLPTWVMSILNADNKDALNKTSDANKAINGVPKGHNTDLNGNADDVKNKAGTARDVIDDVPKDHTTNFFARMAGSAWNNIKNFISGAGSAMSNYWGLSSGGLVRRANGGPIQRLATGGPSGFVTGPGTTTSDSIPALLSNKEYVIAAASARKIGISNLDRMNRTGSLPVSSGSGSASGSGGVSIVNQIDATGIHDEQVLAAYLAERQRIALAPTGGDL